MKNLEKWQALEAEVTRRGGDGAEFVKAMQEHYSVYKDTVYLWLAGLYDKESGGFYYSNSARDNEPFRPDIESTNQATDLIIDSGLIDNPMDFPPTMREQMARFCQNLISPSDGYIYHPQWDYSDPKWIMKDSRMGRDLTWAVAMAEKFEFDYPYPTANERLEASATESDTKEARADPAPHLRSPEALKEYLNSYDWEKNAYFSGNNVIAQIDQILSAGLRDTMVDFLNKKQNPETGLWGIQGGYMGINALLKISSAYREAKALLPNTDKAMKAAIDCITSDEECGTVCFQYNAWFSVSNLLEILNSLGTPEAKELAKKAMNVLLQNAPATIRATTEKVLLFAKNDGAFSYLPASSTGYSQGAPVSIHLTAESDMNASVIASCGTTKNMYKAFGLVDYFVPFFNEEDRKKFINTIKI